MRWNSRSSNSSNNINIISSTSSIEQQNSITSSPSHLEHQLHDDTTDSSDALPARCVVQQQKRMAYDDDDDEQDYSCSHHFDDELDNNPRHYNYCGPGSSVGESSIGQPSPGHSHNHSHSHRHHVDDNHKHNPPPSAQQHHQHIPSSPGPPSHLPPSSLSCAMTPPRPSSSAEHNGRKVAYERMNSATAAAAAVVIEDDDDPGTDHSIPVEDCDGAMSSSAWKPQSQQSTCEFTHTISHYSQKRESGCKKAEYSATTVDCYGNRWRLIVYVNGNGRASNHHLSLFLQVADADELPFGWKKAVSYVLTLEHPSGPSLGYAKRNPDKTFKLCPKAIDWGWSQFITSDRIQQEGYVSNDCLIVRASVTVKSSSVSIDSEDAELYLKCAVEEGNASAVTACLSQGAGVNCQFKDDLYTPLHTACSSSASTGSLEVLKLLLRKGADGNACNKWRETPLLIAANNGHQAAVEALLESGADPSLCSEAGWSALTFAAHKGYDDIVALLLSAGAPVNCRVTEDLSTPLHKACAGGKSGHLAAVRQLLDAGADVHALNKWRETPLLTAANHGQAAAVDSLLKTGADPCKCTDTGWSPLSIAAYKGHDDVVRLLLEQDAPTEEADPTLSALLQAATKGLPDTVELLLRHGADHTVTTKKGDTALSILVEQDLIDAAVEMVTEYKASVQRCSRDRKKVQRARLLINLRVKQQQREGLLNGDIDSEDDSEQDESDDQSNSALHDSSDSPKAATPRTLKKKNKKQKSRENAEAEARAAENALLLELEKEESKAQKEEAAALSKRSKKKKKRDRERQQRLDEEREQQEKVQKELEQTQRELIEREQKERVQKEQKAFVLEKQKQQKERDHVRELKESSAREEKAAVKRRDKEDRERKHKTQEKKEKDKKLSTPVIAHITSNVTTPGASKKGQAKPKGSKRQQNLSSTEAKSDFLDNNDGPQKLNLINSTSKSPSAKRRGWETKNIQPKTIATPVKHTQVTHHVENQHSPVPSQMSSNEVYQNPSRKQPNDNSVSAIYPQSTASFSVEDQLEDMANGVVDFLGFDSPPTNTKNHDQQSVIQNSSLGASNDLLYNGYVNHQTPRSVGGAGVFDKGPIHYNATSVELPAVSLMQQEKITDILSSFSQVVTDKILKTVIYRYMVRAAHGSDHYVDPVIPSWTDYTQLVTFLQRQLIAESRRGNSCQNGVMASIEVLKDTGTTLAELCRNYAKQISQIRTKCMEQLPPDWCDGTLGITSNVTSNMVCIDWAVRSKVCIPSQTFFSLKARYCGPPNRLYTAMFAMVKRYETWRIVVGGTSMDHQLPPATLSSLSGEVSVSMEALANPLTVYGDHAFCGTFHDVDAVFGGYQPFSKDGISNFPLLEHGGSVAVLPPLDSVIGAQYVHTIVDMLEHSEQLSVPLSFSVIIPAECFREQMSHLSKSDLALLDPRLGDKCSIYVRHVVVLPQVQHVFFSGEGKGTSEISQTESLFCLLQNEMGILHFPVNDATVVNIVQSMSPSFAPLHPPSIASRMHFEGQNMSVPSPTPNIGVTDYSNLGRPLIGTGYGNEGGSRVSRRGRLFELIDDGEDEFSGHDADVVSGMLNNLNMFDNNSQDVDIEAISLMGINNSMNGNSVGRFGDRFGIP